MTMISSDDVATCQEPASIWLRCRFDGCSVHRHRTTTEAVSKKVRSRLVLRPVGVVVIEFEKVTNGNAVSFLHVLTPHDRLKYIKSIVGLFLMIDHSNRAENK